MTKQNPNFIDSVRQADADIEITPQMIEAGFAVLCNSGIADEYQAADKNTVAEIFRSMLFAKLDRPQPVPKQTGGDG